MKKEDHNKKNSMSWQEEDAEGWGSDLAFIQWLGEHCDWVVDTSGKEDTWGWETDLEQFKGHYTTLELYSLYIEKTIK